MKRLNVKRLKAKCRCSEKLQANLIADIQQDGPILLWIGYGPGPFLGRKFRGLNLEYADLSAWAELKPRGPQRKDYDRVAQGGGK